MKTYKDEIIISGMKLVQGRIIEISSDGQIWVENDPDGLSIPCYFLRTSTAPLPELKALDLALYAIDEMGTKGYVLGVIQKYIPEAEKPIKVVLSQNPKDEILLNASEKIELHCGKSTLTMEKDGRIIVRGANITTRAKGTNKIKGGSVQIN